MSEKGHFRPIGSNGFYRRGGMRANFDQQPIEAQAMVSACLEAYRATSDFWWYEQAQRAFDWFIGWNDLGLELYSPETGGCRDGLHVDRVNGNQGAESTLAFLLSLAEMRLAQNMVTSFKEPIAIGRNEPPANLSMHLNTSPHTILRPDQSRVLLRPFNPGGPSGWRGIVATNHGASRRPSRPAAGRSIRRVLPAPPADPQTSSWNASNRCASRCRRWREISEHRRLLIGSYFLAEYSLESAALFNPSIVPHPDQTGLPARRAAVHSEPARHRRRAHFLHHFSNRHHPSRSCGSRYCTPTGFLTEPRQIPKPRLREGPVRAETR